MPSQATWLDRVHEIIEKHQLPNLPPTIRFADPCKLEIAFSNPEDLMAQLVEFTAAAANDFPAVLKMLEGSSRNKLRPQESQQSPQWLGWAKQLQAVAQNGLNYAQDRCDIDRYRAVAEKLRWR